MNYPVCCSPTDTCGFFCPVCPASRAARAVSTTTTTTPPPGAAGALRQLAAAGELTQRQAAVLTALAAGRPPPPPPAALRLPALQRLVATGGISGRQAAGLEALARRASDRRTVAARREAEATAAKQGEKTVSASPSAVAVRPEMIREGFKPRPVPKRPGAKSGHLAVRSRTGREGDAVGRVLKRTSPSVGPKATGWGRNASRYFSVPILPEKGKRAPSSSSVSAAPMRKRNRKTAADSRGVASSVHTGKPRTAATLQTLQKQAREPPMTSVQVAAALKPLQRQITALTQTFRTLETKVRLIQNSLGTPPVNTSQIGQDRYYTVPVGPAPNNISVHQSFLQREGGGIRSGNIAVNQNRLTSDITSRTPHPESSPAGNKPPGHLPAPQPNPLQKDGGIARGTPSNTRTLSQSSHAAQSGRSSAAPHPAYARRAESVAAGGRVQEEGPTTAAGRELRLLLSVQRQRHPPPAAANSRSDVPARSRKSDGRQAGEGGTSGAEDARP